MEMKLSLVEIKVINALREPGDFGYIEIRKSKNGIVKRVTIHRESDVYHEEKENEKASA